MQFLRSSEIRAAMKDGSYGLACDRARYELPVIGLGRGLQRIFAIRDDPVACDAIPAQWAAAGDRAALLFVIRARP